MKIKVGISSCLLGNEVRFDGGHKHSKLCTEQLSRYFNFVPECPEVASGMPIPRKPIRLVGRSDSPNVVAVHNRNEDYTQQLSEFSVHKVNMLDDLCGYIFMQKSPSCGVFRVKVYQDNGFPSPEPGRGIFARAIMDKYPLLPVEEAGRLEDAALRENFITRVLAYHQWHQLKEQGITPHKIIEFHSRYKYALMARAPSSYTELGHLLSNAGHTDVSMLAERYFKLLMTKLSIIATRKTHTNVLMHLQGYLKKALSTEEKQELSSIIEQYRTNVVPLIVPITLLKHHFAIHPDPYIEKQTYLSPYPDELSLRNAI